MTTDLGPVKATRKKKNKKNSYSPYKFAKEWRNIPFSVTAIEFILENVRQWNKINFEGKPRFLLSTGPNLSWVNYPLK